MALTLPLALCALACGGKDEGRPRDGAQGLPAIDECAAAAERQAQGFELGAIATFEPTGGGPIAAATCDPATPCGFYFTFDSTFSPPAAACEGLAPEDQAPPPGDFVATGPIAMSPLPEARCGESSHAYHLFAKNIAVCTNPATGRQGWGAALQVTFNPRMEQGDQADPPLDASAWDGLSFWVRTGGEPTGTALFATVKDPYTGRPPSVDGTFPYEPHCSQEEAADDADKCDAFGLAVLFTPEWRFVKLPFALMKQKGFGVPSPLGQLETSVLTGFEFIFSAGDWDVWIDDIAFYREPE